jgi:hypothetical protein
MEVHVGEELAAYLLVLAGSVLPAVLWIRAGAPGVPIVPAIAMMHFIYYALPVASGSTTLMGYSAQEILRSGATVGLFLLAVTVAWRLTAVNRQTRSAAPRFASPLQVTRFTFIGLTAGLAFHVLLISGWLGWLGPYFGLARSVTLTLATLACYFVGVARARGMLRGMSLSLAVAGLVAMVLLAWSSLFLVGGLIYLLAAALGYVIAAKRVPWLALAAAIAVVTVLHAGKAEMRDKYWYGGRASEAASSVIEVPAVLVEWVGTGVAALASGDSGQSLMDRASLLDMLLRAQRLTPRYIGFFEGESYRFLPAMLVPRFLSPDKVQSQAGMELLNIRYGIQTAEGASVTAIGWGPIAEAYANFGYLGVIGVALLLGAFAGAMARWSAGASPVSLATLLTINVMMKMINLETDLSYLIINLWVSSVSVFIFFGVLTLFRRRASSRITQRAFAVRARALGREH